MNVWFRRRRRYRMGRSKRSREVCGHVTLNVVLVAALTSCSTYVKLSVKPDTFVCPGSPVTVAWAAARSPDVIATPPLAGFGSQPHAGELTISPTTGTKFHLEAGVWDWKNQTDADVTLYDPSLATFPKEGQSPLQLAQFGPDVHCTESTAWVAFEQTSDLWDPRLTVGSVLSLSSTPVTVRHAGYVVKVDRSGSTALSGTSMEGVWIIETTCPPPRGIGIEL